MKGLRVEECLEWDLKETVSKVLKIPRNNLSLDENLADFGFDSISLTQFAAALTSTYDIEVTPALFFGYSTLEKLHQYFLQEHGDAIREFYREELPAQPSAWAVLPKTAEPRPVKRRVKPRIAANTVPVVSAEATEPIAIIGMSGRFPQARNVDEMWRILFEGKDVVGEIPADRFDWRLHYGDRSVAPNRINSKWCGSIEDAGQFDPLFFEISPKEAELMDPRQRLLLQESWNALEDAGYGPRQISSGRIGMFVGVEQGDYQSRVGDEGTITSNHNGVLAARLAYFLDFSGPVMSIDTACSSGLVAAHQACLSLRGNECDTAIAAGVNLLFEPQAYISMSQAGMLSDDGKCFAFDKRANGMVPGEAVAVVVLKRLSRAQADGDPIYAVIRGSGINYDGKTNGITAPSGVSQSNLVRSVYDRYAIDPEGIEYIVCHGTGTKLGDPIEVNALYDAFKTYTSKNGYCALTSTKTNFGHTFAASGLVSLIGLVQAMRHETIPASLYCEQESEYINWKESPFFVNKANSPWPEREEVRMGAVSAFGMSGTNAHMVVGSYRSKPDSVVSERHQCYLLLFSAKTEEALQERMAEMATWLENRYMRDEDLLHVSYTLQEGRSHFKCRCALIAADWEDAVNSLKRAGAGEKFPNQYRGTVPRDFREHKTMQEYAEGLIKKGRTLLKIGEEYREILSALADLYCQGYELSFDLLYDDPKPRRVNLPSYPFAKERYLVSGRGENPGAAPFPGRNAFNMDEHLVGMLIDGVMQGTIDTNSAVMKSIDSLA